MSVKIKVIMDEKLEYFNVQHYKEGDEEPFRVTQLSRTIYRDTGLSPVETFKSMLITYPHIDEIKFINDTHYQSLLMWDSNNPFVDHSEGLTGDENGSL